MAQESLPSNPLCLVFDMMCTRISNWERFAKALRIDYVIRDLKENEKYNEVHEKIYKCIDEKRETSVDGDPDWFYWRNILLDIDEEELVEDIEEKYPYLLKDERIDISGVVHKAFDEFGIISHGASKKELFVKLQTKLKDRIKVCVGAGKEKWFQIKNMHTIQDNYFEKYSCVEKIRIYDFSNSGTLKECKILRTMYQWLQKHNDSGFCIKGYDAKQHLKFISEDYFNENPKDSDILVYSKLHNAIFYIDTNPDDIKKSIRHNRSNIRFLCSSNPLLYDASFVFIPLTLYDPTKHEINDKVICKTCIDLKLLESSEIFKDLDLFEKWWKTFSNEVKDVKSELDERADISNDFFRSIMTYMALDYFALPSFTKSPENQITQVQKLILLTPEQQNIIYSTHRYKIIKGSFGSGKTVVAQKILELVSNTPNSSELVYYIMHDSDSSFVKEMEKVATKLNKENVTVCKRSDLVKDTQALSSILEYLLAANKGKIIHVFIEEFNAEYLNTNEIEKVKILLKREEFKDSHIVLVAQSMESERTETNDKLETKLYETYKYKELVEETDFEVFYLSFLMRSSQHINDMVNIAIPILEEAKMKSIIPKFDSELVSESVVPASSITKNLSNNTKTDYNIQVNTDIACSDMSKDNNDNKISDDTGQFLKQCTILADKYLSKSEIESSYTFVGDRKKAHNVEGEKPTIYYPLQNENEEFVHQVYCVSEVLKVLLNNDKVQVIICLNLDSLSIIKSALEINRTKWTDDPQLLSTKEFNVCLTDYTSVRGCEFMNVILIYPTNEQHLKHNLVDCISRCVFSLRVVVLNLKITDKTLLEILDEWTKQKLVNVSNEDYLKNVNYEELKMFEEYNHDILNSRFKMQNMDINNPRVIQKLQSFKRSQSESSSVVQISNESLIIKSTTSFKGGIHQPFINEENTTNCEKRKLESIDKNVELIPGFILFFPEKDNDVIIPGSILNTSSQRCKSNIEYVEGNPLVNNLKVPFFTTLYINGINISQGSGDTKKESKYNCANKALEKLKLCQPIIYKEKVSLESIETVDRNDLVTQSYNIAEKIKDDNIVGCSGTGGFGKSGSGTADPVFVDAADDRKGVGHNDEDQTIQTRSVDATLKLFLEDTDKDHIKFSSDLTSTDRKLVHQLCERYRLKHISFGKNDERYLLVSRK